QESGQTAADKTRCPGDDNSGRFGHASTIDSISFSMAVSYSCFHSRILPHGSPSTCTIAVVTVPNSSRGTPCMAFLNSAVFSFLTVTTTRDCDSPNQYASRRKLVSCAVTENPSSRWNPLSARATNNPPSATSWADSISLLWIQASNLFCSCHSSSRSKCGAGLNSTPCS